MIFQRKETGAGILLPRRLVMTFWWEARDQVLLSYRVTDRIICNENVNGCLKFKEPN